VASGRLSPLLSYLIEFRHFTLIKVGIFASLPLWAGVVGDIVGGLTTDWLLAKTGNIKFARRAVAITGMLGCAVFIVPAAMTESAYTAVYCLTAAMFFLECTIGPSWAVPMDMGGEHSGTVSGRMNMAGNIGGALSPLVLASSSSSAPGRRRSLWRRVCSFSAPRFGDSGWIQAPRSSKKGSPDCSKLRCW
jgi:sugar phosphate permease